MTRKTLDNSRHVDLIAMEFRDLVEAKSYGAMHRDRDVKLSVVIPAYNVSSCIDDTINSVISNSSHINLEIIVVNDGSLDDTVDVVHSSLKHYFVPTTIVTIPNSGLSAARNVGLSFASGPYVAFLDADDLMAPDAYGRLVAFAETEGCQQVFARSSCFRPSVFDDQEFFDSAHWKTILSGISMRAFHPLNEPLVFYTEPKMCTRIWRASYLRDNKLIFPEGRIFEDIGIHLRSLALNGRVGIMDIQGLFYRVGRSGALTMDKSRKRFDVIANIEEALQASEIKELPGEIGAYALLSILRMCEWSQDSVNLRVRSEFTQRLSECYQRIPRQWVKHLTILDGRAAKRFLSTYMAALPAHRRIKQAPMLRRLRRRAKKSAGLNIKGGMGLGRLEEGREPQLVERFAYSDYRCSGPGPATLATDTVAVFLCQSARMRAARFARARPQATVYAIDTAGDTTSEILKRLPNVCLFQNRKDLLDEVDRRETSLGFVDIGVIGSDSLLGLGGREINFVAGYLDVLDIDVQRIQSSARSVVSRGYFFRQSDGPNLAYAKNKLNNRSVSIVVPIYNVQDYMNKCIESLSDQTLHDREIILVDDGSTDDSGYICDEWARRDATIKVIHKPNGGCASARMAGLEAATGEFVTFVDGDDWVDTSMLERLYNLALKTGDDVIEGGWGFAFPSGAVDEQTNLELSQCYPSWNGVTRRRNALAIIGQPTIWRRLYRRSFLQDHGVSFDPQLRRFDDMPFQFECLTRVGDIAYVEKCLTFYRQNREGQDIGLSDDRLFIHFPILAKLREIAIASGNVDRYREFITIQFNTHIWALSKINEDLIEKYRAWMARDIFGVEQICSPSRMRKKLIELFPGKKIYIWKLYAFYITKGRNLNLPKLPDIR